MKKTALLLILVVVVLLVVAGIAKAQQPKKIPRIGYVSGTGNATDQGPYVEALRVGLRELGHIEGKTFVIEYRGAEGQIERVPSLIEELVKLKVDLLVAPTPIATEPLSRQPQRSPSSWSPAVIRSQVAWLSP
jgi:ABC-type sugar transport system substrate-binding protein